MNLNLCGNKIQQQFWSEEFFHVFAVKCKNKLGIQQRTNLEFSKDKVCKYSCDDSRIVELWWFCTREYKVITTYIRPNWSFDCLAWQHQVHQPQSQEQLRLPPTWNCLGRSLPLCMQESNPVTDQQSNSLPSSPLISHRWRTLASPGSVQEYHNQVDESERAAALERILSSARSRRNASDPPNARQALEKSPSKLVGKITKQIS